MSAGRPQRVGSGNQHTIIDPPVDTSPKATANALRLTKALEMKVGGATYQAIADQCGYGSKQAAHQAVTRALRDLPVDGARELRQVQIERLDALLASVWPNAINAEAERPGRPGEVQTPAEHIAYLNAALGIMSDIRDLMGLDFDNGMVDEATDQGMVVIGGTKEQYMAALEAMTAARDANRSN